MVFEEKNIQGEAVLGETPIKGIYGRKNGSYYREGWRI
jgi:hypothetical protein